MKVSDQTINYFKNIITGDSWKTPYLSWPKLISYFSKFWFNDEYWNDFPSRWYYCEQKLTEMNNQNRIKEIIEDYYQPINFINNTETYKLLLNEINNFLLFDDLELKLVWKKIELISIVNSNISQANFSENVISIIINNDVFNHVKTLLESGHYFNAVEESYKIVRAKLKSIIWEE